jgi:hypothetical protein
MKLPASSPALRGMPLRIVAWLLRFDVFRDLLLARVRKDSNIAKLPDTR